MCLNRVFKNYFEKLNVFKREKKIMIAINKRDYSALNAC